MFIKILILVAATASFINVNHCEKLESGDSENVTVTHHNMSDEEFDKDKDNPDFPNLILNDTYLYGRESSVNKTSGNNSSLASSEHPDEDSLSSVFHIDTSLSNNGQHLQSHKDTLIQNIQQAEEKVHDVVNQTITSIKNIVESK